MQIDNTALALFRRCPREYHLRIEKEWVPNHEAPSALLFGKIWHDCMDRLWLCVSEGIPDPLRKCISPDAPLYFDDKRNLQTLLAMLESYLEERRWFIREVEVVSVEQPFFAELDEDIQYVGRWDKLIRHRGKLKVVEHKTTSIYRKEGNFSKSYIEEFFMNPQVLGYLWVGKETFGDEFDEVLVDVVLVHEKHTAQTFVPIRMGTDRLREWYEDTLGWISILKSGRRPANPDSCRRYGRLCAYYDLCRWGGWDAEGTPEGFTKEAWDPLHPVSE